MCMQNFRSVAQKLWPLRSGHTNIHGWMEWAVYRTDPPVHRRRPAQEYQDDCMASCSSQLQDALSPTGYQEMLPHRSGTAKYLGCASSRSQGVYTIYTMSCPDPTIESPYTPSPQTTGVVGLCFPQTTNLS